MRVPEAMSFAELVELAERHAGRHVGEVLQNIMDLHLSDDRSADEYGLRDALDADEPIEGELIEIILEKIEEGISDRPAHTDNGDDDVDEDVGDDPYAVSTATLRDTRTFLQTILREFD